MTVSCIFKSVILRDIKNDGQKYPKFGISGNVCAYLLFIIRHIIYLLYSKEMSHKFSTKCWLLFSITSYFLPEHGVL